MRKKMSVWFMLLIAVPGLLLMISCAKHAVKSSLTEDQVETIGQQAAQKAQAEAIAKQRAMEEERLRQERLREEQARAAAERAKMMARSDFINQDIYFEFDSSALLPMAQDTLAKKAQWLRDNPGVSVIIEGHCDERGTNEYNLALGDRRAGSAKTYLINLGIDASRLSTISYGEERPVDPGHNEEAWAKNRRAHFAIE